MLALYISLSVLYHFKSCFAFKNISYCEANAIIVIAFSIIVNELSRILDLR